MPGGSFVVRPWHASAPPFAALPPCSRWLRRLALTAYPTVPRSTQSGPPNGIHPSEGPGPKPLTKEVQVDETFAWAVRGGQKKLARPLRRAARRAGCRGILPSNERRSRHPVGPRGLALGFPSHRPPPTGASGFPAFAPFVSPRSLGRSFQTPNERGSLMRYAAHRPRKGQASDASAALAHLSRFVETASALCEAWNEVLDRGYPRAIFPPLMSS
jgi:hypothetical protein